MKKDWKIAIIGAGALGSALARVLEKNQDVKVDFWDIDPKKLSKPAKLEDVCAGADFAFLCTPSQHIREGLKSAMSCVDTGVPLISFAKGIEIKSGKTMSELFEEILDADRPWAIFGGPMLAKELEAGLPGAATLGVKAENVFNATGKFKEFQELFAPTNLVVDCSTDAQGVALGGVLKNVYALTLGIVTGLGMGSNALGLFAVQAVKEMMTITDLLGGKKETVLTYAGVGDLIATGFSEYSRNRSAGVEMVRSGVCKMEPEGCVSIGPLVKRLGSENISALPVLSVTFKTVQSPKGAKEYFALCIKEIKQSKVGEI